MSITPIRARWSGTMTDRERFVNQLHYRPVDRCYNMEFGYWEENYHQWTIFTANGVTKEWQANQLFGLEGLPMVGGNVFMHPAFEQKVIEENGDRIILQNAEGLLAEKPRDGHSTIPHFTKSSIHSPGDWKRVKEERFCRDDPARRVDIATLKQRHPGCRDYPLGVNCGSMIGKVRDMLTFEGLACASCVEPDMVEDMVETCCVLVEDFLDQVLPHFRFDFAGGWEDICFKNGPIITPDFFKQVVVPRYKRIGAKLRAAGIDIWYTDCDGDVRPIIEGFLEAGINTMFPFEVACSGHPGELLDRYGRDLRILGGFDKRQLIAGKDAIGAYMKSLLPWVERGGFIPFCDHRCPPDVTEENYLYYLDLKKEMFMRPFRR